MGRTIEAIVGAIHGTASKLGPRHSTEQVRAALVDALPPIVASTLMDKDFKRLGSHLVALPRPRLEPGRAWTRC